MKLVALTAPVALALAACGATIPRAELDRCKLGVADGNDGYTVRQGAACGSIANRLAASDRPTEALAYALKACELEDARGCQEYLALVRRQPSLPPDELLRARGTGEKACAGMVFGTDGADARPAICVRTAELYEDVEPRSRDDAARLYARACKLGDDKSCTRASALGARIEDTTVAVAPKTAPPAPPPNPQPATTVASALPKPTPTPTTSSSTAAAPPAPACHEMRPCVSLDLQQRNTNEVVGTITNHCSGTVACTWCPARGSRIDKSACHSVTLPPNESRTGRESGLWYEGFNAMAYDCMDANDSPGCLGM